MLGLLFWLLACAPEALELTVEPVEQGFAVAANAELDRVELSAGGVLLVKRRLPAPTSELTVSHPWEGEQAYTLTAQAGGKSASVEVVTPARAAAGVTVQAPVGSAARPVLDGDVVELQLVEGETVQVALRATTRTEGTLAVRVGDELQQKHARAGEDLLLLTTLAGPVDATVTTPDGTLQLDIVPRTVTREALARELSVEATAFPVGSSGGQDLARPADRVTLPAGWWRALMDTFDLGFRARDDHIPWAWRDVTLRNEGSETRDVVVTQRVLVEGGHDPVFLPRLRGDDDGTGRTSALLRVPALSSATARLPVFVDEDALEAGVPRPRSVETTVALLGASGQVVEHAEPLYVSRGSDIASLGIAAAFGVSLAGAGLLTLRLRRWLARPTSELVTVALFASLMFVVGAASQLVGLGISAILGPFSGLFTALIDDALRYALLATLIGLLPRPGVAALATLIVFLLRGMALGSLDPVGVVYVLARVAWLEGALWACGLTRGTSWLDRPRATRLLVVTLGFSLAAVCSAATGLVLHVVLYRLFLAPWYVAMILLGPNLLYVALACWLATGFGDALRRVEA